MCIESDHEGDESYGGVSSSSPEKPKRRPSPQRVGTPAPTAEWINDQQLADWLGVSRETVQAWRTRKKDGKPTPIGPPWIKMGRLVRYHVPAVRSWLDRQRGGD